MTPLEIILLAALAISIALHVARTLIPLPPFDKGSSVLSVANKEAMHVLVSIARDHGIAPRFRADSKLALRAIMQDGSIINVPLVEEMKIVGGAKIFRSSDPTSSAIAASRRLEKAGFTSTISYHPDPDMPENTMTMIVTSASPNLIGFRLSIDKMPKPKPWSDYQ